MQTKIGLFAVFSLVLLMVTPAYASVTSLSLEKSFYTSEELFNIVGEQDGKDIVFVIIRDSNGNFKGMLSDPTPDQGEFSVIPRPVSNFFDRSGMYNATAFTDNEKEENGTSILIEFDGSKIYRAEDFVLQLKPIADVTVDELNTVSFTAAVTDSSIEDVVYSLEKNPPSGATINSNTGKFVWTPSSSHGNSPGAKYTFDIVATKGSQVDRESITITVNEPVAVPPEPKPKSEPKELGLAPFVDETKDPQYYVDRYNNEASYKKWFDNNYPDMTIYEAVGIDEPEIKEPEIGECGTGTKLVDGKCIVDTSVKESQGGGCLIATATYGSEMAPQVQFLREIRDGQLMGTSSGVSFMSGFNQLYYSFSPYVADYERENPAFKELVKIGITPLLSSLSVMEHAESESEVLGYGIGVILLNIGMYFVAPVMLFYGIKRVRRVKF